MNIFASLIVPVRSISAFIRLQIFFKVIFIVASIAAEDVCMHQRCQCFDTSSTVNCDTKGWKNLDDIDFPSSVRTLTLNNNNLKFDASKYE